MAGKGRKNADDALLVALASGRSIQDAARIVGISDRTAARRMVDPAFKKRIARARATMLDRALGVLADAASDGAAELRTLLRAKSEQVRLGAARALVELSGKLWFTMSVEQRVADLEDWDEEWHKAHPNASGPTMREFFRKEH